MEIPPFSHGQILAISLGALALTPAAWAHPDKVEDRLLVHFATGAHPVEKGTWPDLTHRFTASLQGQPKLENLGPAQVLRFDGYHDWLMVAPDRGAAEPGLPKREMSLVAWINLADTRRLGGIIGFMQDNGDEEKGWVLGYNRKNFTFRLASQGADDGNGRLTELKGKTAIERDRWHFVVATYDGAAMRLYVDGALDGESKEQSGDALYPEQGRYAIGAYVDRDELFPMEGAIFEAKVYNRALSANEISDEAKQNAALLDWRSPVNRDLQFVVRPYLQYATAESMTVMCETGAESKMTVEYGETQPLTLSAKTTEARYISELKLTGLAPFTRYFYRVTCEDEKGNLARSEALSFQTAPGPNLGWAFGILGDTQRNPEVTRRCAEGLFELRPNFLLHCGDVVDDGHAKQQWVYDLLEPCSKLSSQIPIFPVIGNHEKNSHWYYDYFSLPAPEYYYTFHYGNAQFFMIDSNKDCSSSGEQYRWLEKELAKSTATWKFAAHHHPCFSSDEDDYGDHLKGKEPGAYVWGDGNARQLVPLYEKYGLDVAWAGHIHSYERTWPILDMTINEKRGVRYIVSGGGGGQLEQAAPQRSWFTVHVKRGYHYCLAAAHDRTIEFKAYDLEGRLFDTFALTKEPGR